MLVELKLFLEDIKADGAAERTLFNYEKWINSFFDKMGVKKSSQLMALKKADIQRYRLELEEEGLSDSTVNTYTAAVKSFFSFLQREDYIEKNPAETIKLKKIPPKPMVYLSEEEASRLIKACSKKRQKAMFYLMISTGLRISEVLDLTMDDIVDNADAGISSRIHINNAKRGETRYIPLSRLCKRYINDYIGRKEVRKLNGDLVYDPNGNIVYSDGERVPPSSRLADKNYLFTSNTGGRCDPTNINRELKTLCKKAGIDKNVTCHKLRATAATIQSIHGTNMKNIQTMLGHKTQEMTARYVQMVDKNYQEEIVHNGLLMEEEENEKN